MKERNTKYKVLCKKKEKKRKRMSCKCSNEKETIIEKREDKEKKKQCSFPLIFACLLYDCWITKL